MKRALDIFGSLVIGILSSPVWAITAIAVKLDSKGPVIFTHQRVGKGGHRFNLYKFRSMYQGAHIYKESPTSPKDLRITRVGAIIRRFSIDELPQIINVLKGEMSLVGPRPEMPYIVDAYNETQKKRLLVKPGITGLWQISPDRNKPIHDNIHHDLYYLENQSIWLDLKILAKTFMSRGI